MANSRQSALVLEQNAYQTRHTRITMTMIMNT